MGIADELDATEPNYPNTCGVALAALNHPDLVDDILAAVSRHDRSARIIADVLAKHDVVIPVSAIQRHRRGDCRCK